MTRATYSDRQRTKEQVRSRRTAWRVRQPKTELHMCRVCKAMKPRAGCIWDRDGNGTTCSSTCSETLRHRKAGAA
jgi:hypothetical protein